MTIKIDFDLFIDIVEFPSHLILTADGAGNNEDYYETTNNTSRNNDTSGNDVDFSLLHDDDDTSYGGDSMSDYYDMDDEQDGNDLRFVDEQINEHLARLQAEIEERIAALTNNDIEDVRLLQEGRRSTTAPSSTSLDTQDNSDADSLVLANSRGVPRRPLEFGFEDSLRVNRSRVMDDLPPLISIEDDILDIEYESDSEDDDDDNDDFSISESDFEDIDAVVSASPATTTSNEEDDMFTTYIVSLDDMKIIGVDEDCKGVSSEQQQQAGSSSSANRCPPRRGILRRTSSSMGSNARRSSATANTRA